MNKRNLNLKKYGISGKRYKELCGFCEQYPEWKEELASPITPRTPNTDGMPHGKGRTGDETGEAAVRRAEMRRKIELIECTAKEAGDDLWEAIIKSVCYEQPFWYLQDICQTPISRSSFYDKRKYFFYLLSKRHRM